MKVLRMLACCWIVAASAAVFPERATVVHAQLPQCSAVCSPEQHCEYPCMLDEEYINCGQYGLCDSPGGCNPNWQPVDYQLVGGTAFDDYIANECYYYRIYDVTMHDVNECGDPDWVGCAAYQEATDYAGMCCGLYGCFGQQSC